VFWLLQKKLKMKRWNFKMAEFNKELIRALANGSKEAHEEIKSLPLSLRMAIGIEVDKMRRDENIIPMDGGKFSLYEQEKVSQEDQDELGQALAKHNQHIREAEEHKIKIREEHLAEVAKQQAERARAGLTRNDR
jgi:hypothetical protein